MKHLTIILFLIIFVTQSRAEVEDKAQEPKLPIKSVFTEFVPSSKEALSTSFSKDALPYWGVILGTTGILYQYDEQIYAEAQKKGRDWRIGNYDNTKPLVSAFGQELVRVPTDTGSFMYFLGDGWTHATIAIGMGVYGSATENNRAYNTGIMIAHGMVVSTVFNQTLKRSFGRESPEVKTSERGSWNLFPSFKEYNSRTASYDAMPSGHVMTATLTWTILTERYPEYGHILYPVAGVWVSALMFQMVNNGVHWASDYPLGIAMGYLFGKTSTHMLSRNEKKKDDVAKETAWTLYPVRYGDLTMLKASRAF
jgi:membrane-associated phospholipid phosphatase